MAPSAAPPSLDVHQQAELLTPLVARLRRAVNRRVRERLGDLPLPEAQIDVLRVVAAEDQPRIQDVAERLQLAPNTVSTLVRALADAGMLARRADRDDGRVVRLALTAPARRRITAWRAVRRDVVAQHLLHLSGDERRALHAALPALERLTASLERDRA